MSGALSLLPPSALWRGVAQIYAFITTKLEKLKLREYIL
jgi:hypothetical protein